MKHKKYEILSKKENLTYEGIAKETIRNYKIKIINELSEKMKKIIKVLEFFGAGQSLELLLAKTTANILSIDNNPAMAKKFLKTPNTRLASLSLLAEEAKEKFHVIDADYTGQLGKAAQNDMSKLGNIMQNKGVLFITIQMRDCKLPKGTMRADIEFLNLSMLHCLFGKQKIELKKEFIMQYGGHVLNNGKRKKNSDTPMKLYMFTWRKTKKKNLDHIPNEYNNCRLITLEDLKNNNIINKDDVLDTLKDRASNIKLLCNQ